MQKYAVVIDPAKKELHLQICEYLDSSCDVFFQKLPMIELEQGVVMRCFPLSSIDGNVQSATFYLCLEDEIHEIQTGLASVEFNTLEEAKAYLKKMEEMVVWRYV